MKKPPSITTFELTQALDHMDRTTQLLVRIMAETGLRVSDVLKMRVFELIEGRVIKESKTGKHRKITLSEELQRDITNADMPYFGYLFPSPRRSKYKPIHRVTVWRRIKRAADKANIRCTPHSLRRYYAQSVFRATNSLEAVQRALGHKYALTTATYLGFDIDLLLNVFANFLTSLDSEASPT